MFIMRNYSQNNLQGATDYNEHGLPVRFENSKIIYFIISDRLFLLTMNVNRGNTKEGIQNRQKLHNLPMISIIKNVSSNATVPR